MGTNLVLIAGGIGITPLMSMLGYLDEAVPSGKATLIYSARTPSELIFRQDLVALSKRNPNIRIVVTITRPGAEQWSGRTGRIDDDLLRAVGPDRSALYYVCGPAGFPETIGEILQRLGVYTAARMRAESWS
jgi:ferredoxin-NADP reductase